MWDLFLLFFQKKVSWICRIGPKTCKGSSILAKNFDSVESWKWLRSNKIKNKVKYFPKTHPKADGPFGLCKYITSRERPKSAPRSRFKQMNVSWICKRTLVLKFYQFCSAKETEPTSTQKTWKLFSPTGNSKKTHLVQQKTPKKNDKLRKNIRFFFQISPVCCIVSKTLRSSLCWQNFWFIVKSREVLW